MRPLRVSMLSLACLLVSSACDSSAGKDAPAAEPAAKQGEDAKQADAKPADAKQDEGKQDDAAKPAEPKPEFYGGEFCDVIIPCFQKFEFTGNFAADVAVDVEPDGSVSAVSFTGEAPKPVQSCISEDIKKIKLATYNGKPGRTKCNQSGQLMAGGGQMVMSDAGYEVREAPAE